MKNLILPFGLIALVGLPACQAPNNGQPTPTMSKTEALVFCRALEERATKPQTTVKLGVGVSNGVARPIGNVSVGFDVSSQESRQKRFERCVLEKSGQTTTEAVF